MDKQCDKKLVGTYLYLGNTVFKKTISQLFFLQPNDSLGIFMNNNLTSKLDTYLYLGNSTIIT